MVCAEENGEALANDYNSETDFCNQDSISNVMICDETVTNPQYNTDFLESQNNIISELRLLRKGEEEFRKEFLRIRNEEVNLLKENNELMKKLLDKIPVK